MRKIVQVATTTLSPNTKDEVRATEDEFVVTALCDDGTVWNIQPDRLGAQWQQLPGIPQD